MSVPDEFPRPKLAGQFVNPNKRREGMTSASLSQSVINRPTSVIPHQRQLVEWGISLYVAKEKYY